MHFSQSKMHICLIDRASWTLSLDAAAAKRLQNREQLFTSTNSNGNKMNLLAMKMDFSKFYLHNLVTLFIKVFKKLDPICQPNVHCSKLSKSSHNMKLHGMDQKKLVCDEIFECLFLESELVFETYLYK